MITKPSQRIEQTPGWIEKDARAAGQPPAAPEPALPAEGLPDWLMEVEAEIPAEAVEAPRAPAAPPPAVSAPAAPAMPDLSDEDAALAWLEGLAAKQGIPEEEMITRPGQRVEQTPGWIQKDAAATTPSIKEAPKPPAPKPAVPAKPTAPIPPIEAKPPVSAPPAAGEALPAWLQEVEAVAPPPEIPVFIEKPTPSSSKATAPTAGMPSWIKEEATSAAPSQPAPEEEIPSWMRAAEETEAPGEVPEWMRAAQEEPVDLNTASLVQLETLPGVGFILAQNIINYRETSGKFNKLEDLHVVPGITSAMIEELRPWVKVIPPFVPKPLPQTTMLRVDISQARRVASQGDPVKAAALYVNLLKNGHSPKEIILDLQDALYHHPEDVYLWEALGDAFVRDGQLQEALDAYTKAEEFLT